MDRIEMADANPSQCCLFLPDRLVAGGPNALRREQTPWFGPALPFPRRPNASLPEGSELPKEVILKPLRRFPLSTEGSFTTKTPAYIKDMPERFRLKTIVRSSMLWNKCKKYADADPNGRNTWNEDGTDGLPDPRQQCDGIHRIYTWFTWFAQRGEGMVNCELAVQDEVHNQLVVPMNALLQVCDLNRPVIHTIKTHAIHH